MSGGFPIEPGAVKAQTYVSFYGSPFKGLLICSTADVLQEKLTPRLLAFLTLAHEWVWFCLSIGES